MDFPVGTSEQAAETGPVGAAVPETQGAAPPRLLLRGVSHAYGRERVLDRVDLAVEPGEILCLLGPSGCGKTTLLRIAAGVEEQTEGAVVVDGEVVADGATFVPAERRALGFVFQDYALFPHLRVIHNVTYGLAGMPRREAEAAAREALANIGLAGYERSYPHALSGGEQQRTALVRALLPSPRALLLDEPFSGLDRMLRERVREDTAALLRARGATAVVVTHDPEEALAIADRIAVMERGRIVQIATPRTLHERPANLYAAGLFSELNTLPARVRGRAVGTPFGPVPAAGHAEGAAVTVAFRPDHLHIVDTPGSGTVAARVAASRFFGATTRFRLEVEGIDGLVTVSASAAADAAPGETVFVAADSERFFVFGEDGRRGTS